VEAFYETPMVSHSPIEPMNALAKWTGDENVEIWASTQVPRDVVTSFAKEYKIPEENVKVNVLFNGGGFGRRLYPDYIHEAVQIAKKVGKPVKVIWTREDDTKAGPFRPMTFSAMKAGLGADGKPLAFQHKVIAPSMMESDNGTFERNKEDGYMTEAISDQKYEIPNMGNAYVYSSLHIPIAAWRAVTSTTLAFAHECFMDELAVKAGKDPMTYRLELAKKDSDLFRILTKLKEVSKWDQPLPAGSSRGVAQYEFFAGHAGFVVEVSKKDKGVKIDKVHCVIDMGTVVNPDGGITWEPVNLTSCEPNGDTAYFVNNYVYSSYGQDELLFPINLDLSQMATAFLRFDVAYAPYFDGNAFIDSLLVQLSDDCGATTRTLFRSGGEALSTTTSGIGANNLYEYDAFSPQSCEEWRTIEIDLSEFLGRIITLRVVNKSGYGNNMYIDNISFNGDYLVGTQTTGSLTMASLSVTPNPASGQTRLKGTAPFATQALLRILDATGRTVDQRKLQVPSGNFEQQLSVENLPAGVYWIKLSGENGAMWPVTKLVVD
jgi:hypothetical protein